jgi:hypothetical protein
MNQVGGLLSKYAGGATGSENEDFDQVAQHAPKDMLTSGIAAALKSDGTPPLGQAISQVFANSSGDQKAGILNTIIAAVGPGLIQQVLQSLNLGSLAGMLGGGNVSPQQAEQVPPHAVEQIAEQAQAQNPGIVDQLSGYLAGNPGLMKSLGGGALSAVMSRMGQ